MIFAYLRKSTNKAEQKHDRQKLAIQNYAESNKFEVDEWIEETVSGSINADKRPLYNSLKDKLRKDDVLIITDIDRLGRNADDTIAELKDLKKNGVRVVALDVPHMNEWNKMQDGSIYEMVIDIVITLKAHMAQQEKEKIVERINQGLAAARSKGKKLGRPNAELPKDFIRKYRKYKDGEYGKMSATAFAKMLGIGRSTLYKYIDLYNKKEKV